MKRIFIRTQWEINATHCKVFFLHLQSMIALVRKLQRLLSTTDLSPPQWYCSIIRNTLAYRHWHSHRQLQWIDGSIERRHFIGWVIQLSFLTASTARQFHSVFLVSSVPDHDIWAYFSWFEFQGEGVVLLIFICSEDARNRPGKRSFV